MNIYDLILNKKVDTQIYTGNISSLSPLKFRIYTTDTEIPCKSVTSLLGAKVGSNVILMKINNQFIITSIVDAISSVDADITAIESVNTAQSTAISTITSTATVQSTVISTIDSVNTSQSTAISTIESVNTIQSTAISTVTSVNTVQSTAIANLESKYRYVKKASQTSRNSTTLLADDPHLTVSLAANKSYHVSCYMQLYGDTLYRYKCAWTVTDTLSFVTDRQCTGAGYTTTNCYLSPVHNTKNVSYDTATAYGVDGSTNNGVREDFIVSGGSNGGTLTLQWAQSTSGSTNTILASSSYMTIQEITTV